MEFKSFTFSQSPILWYQICLIGVIIFLAGTVAFFWTTGFINILITLFGVLALVVGFVMIVFFLTVDQDIIYRFPIFLAGILSIIVAGIAILLPGFIQTTFIIIMAFLAIINSVLLILVGCSLSDTWKVHLVIVLFGMLTLFLSILMALFPELSAVILVKIWGIYAFVIGTLCIVAGLSLKMTMQTVSLPSEKAKL
jgi:uncharacterized membrane protein HdeD (DUF308 family)